MSVIKGLDGLNLDKDTAFHKKVGFIVANVDTVIEDLDALLLDHLDLCFAQFVGKRILYGVNVRLARGCQARFAGLVEPGRPAGGGRPQLDLHGLGANEAAVFM